MDEVRLRPANRPVEEVFPSQWLRVSDITQPTTLTIKQVGETDLYNPFDKKKETTIVLLFNEIQQMMPCGPGRAKTLAEQLKESIPAKWTGRRIRISVVIGDNRKRGFKIEAVQGQPTPVPTPAEKSTTERAQANGNGHTLPPRPWKPEDLKHILATSAGKKNISGQISDKDAQLIAGKIQAVFAGPAQEGQDAQERKAAVAKAELDYHEVIGWLFDSAHGEDGTVSAKNLAAAEGATVLGWLLEPVTDPATGQEHKNKWHWNLKKMAVTELLSVRDSLRKDEIPF
jgi:hypothetical protein